MLFILFIIILLGVTVRLIKQRLAGHANAMHLRDYIALWSTAL